MIATAVLIVVAVWTAWLPAETRVTTAPLLALVILALLPWAYRRTDPRRLTAFAASAVLLAVFAFASAVAGWDRSQAISDVALATAVVSVAWLASRCRPSELSTRVFAICIAALTLWAIWQVFAGFEIARLQVGELSAHMQANAADRLDSGRAFASLLLPSHLAVLLASALPLLVSGIDGRFRSVPWVCGAGLCIIGLALTRSPIGIGLALAAVFAMLTHRRGWLPRLAAVGLALGLCVAILLRPDVARLEPFKLRFDNWRTAAWLYSTSPIVGVGLGSYGQASQAVPFAVKNRPMHAHSLPMEWLAELGLVGCVASAAAVVGLLLLLRRLWPHRPALAVAIAVVPLHNLVDFSLYTTGVAIPWALLLGWGFAVAWPPPSAHDGIKGRLPIVAVAATVAALTLLHAASELVESGAIGDGSPAERFESVRSASRLAPWRVEPALVASLIALEDRDGSRLEGAARMLDRSRRLRPHSAAISALSSRVELARGRIPSALCEGWIAADAQPYWAEHRDHFDAMVEKLAEFSAGGDGR